MTEAPSPRDGESSEAGSPAQGISRSLAHGIAWTTAMRWGTQAVTWVSTIVVARLLTPQDYGIVSMASVYLGIVALLSEFGLGSAIVMLPTMSAEQIAQINLASVMIGSAAFGVSLLLAGQIGAFFHAADLPLVLRVMSLGFLISSFRSVPAALLQKRFEFKRLALIDGVQALVVSSCAMVLAFLGCRYWTLVAGNLLGITMGTVAVLFFRRCGFSWPRLGPLRHAFSFSGQLLVARCAWYINSNSDFAVAGRVLGKTALGAYTLAWTLASVPVEKVSAIVFSVTPAYFAAAQRDFATLRRYLLLLSEGVALITFPATLGLALVAPEFVRVVIGSKWEAAILPLQILGAYSTVRSLSPILPQILGVTGDIGFTMWNSIGAAIFFPIAFYLGSRWGINGIAAAWLFAHPIMAIPLYWRVCRRIDLKVAEYLRALWPATSSALLMVAAVLVLKIVMPGGWSTSIRLGAEIALGAIAYAGSTFLFHRKRLDRIRGALRSPATAVS